MNRKILKSSIMICVLFLILSSTNIYKNKFNAYENEISSEKIVSDQIEIFEYDTDNFFLITTDGSKTVVTNFCAKDKTSTKLLEEDFAYVYARVYNNKLFLAQNIQNQIEVSSYILYNGQLVKEAITAQIQTTFVKKSYLATDNKGILIYIDKDNPKNIRYKSKTLSYNDEKFLEIQIDSTGENLYAVTEMNNFVKFNLKDYSCIKISISPGDYYRFINSSNIVASEGTVYYLENNELTNKFTLESQQNLVLANFEGYILEKTSSNTVKLLNKTLWKYEKQATLSGEILNLYNNNLYSFAILKQDSTFYFIIFNSSSFADIPGSETPIEPEPGTDPETPPDPEVEPISTENINLSSNIYQIDSENALIFQIAPNTSITEFKRNISFSTLDYKISFKNYLGKTITSGNIGSGSQIIFENEKGETCALTNIVYGDLTGSGSVNTSDYNALNNYILGKSTLEGIFLKAADINNDGVADTLDLLLMNKMINGT